MKIVAKLLMAALLYVAGPLLLSFWSERLTLTLQSLGVILPVSTWEYLHIANLCVDLFTRSLYFLILIIATRSIPSAVVLFFFQTLTMLMFLRYGATTLYAAVVGSFAFFGP
jgi:hypothetical protein